MWSDTMLQASVKSPSAVSRSSSVDQQVMDPFVWMKTMLSSFLGPRQDTITAAFCNYLASEVEALEERDFQTLRNQAVKLLSTMKSRAKETCCQPQQSQQQTLSSKTSNATFLPQTFEQSMQPAPAAKDCILIIPVTQMPASYPIQPTQQRKVATKEQ